MRKPDAASAPGNRYAFGLQQGLFEALKGAHVGLPSPGAHRHAEMYSRKIHVRPGRNQLTARGTDATWIVAGGNADLAILPVSEILHAAGVDFAGRIAPEIQFVQVFSAAVVAGSGEIEASKRLIEFLASGHASEAIRNSGMEPLGTSEKGPAASEQAHVGSHRLTR